MGSKGAYITFDNEITHRYTYLQMPNYEPSEYYPDNSGYSNERVFSQDEKIYLNTSTQQTHYHVNAAGLRLLGTWFDYLRKLDVYDNTKIIIVADHGYGLGLSSDFMYGASDLDYYNPLFLVKDFNSTGEIKYDNTLMTTADVPTIATEGVIKNAKNPFTGSKFIETVKKDEVHVLISHNWDVANHISNNTYGSYLYFNVKDNIFDLSNWSTKNIYPTQKEEETTNAKVEETPQETEEIN